MDIGSELRSARNARALSLNELAHATKISHSVLRAIESNAFHNVPGGLFTRGYLRAYARAVGLDPEAVVRHYRAEFEAPEPAEPAAEREPTAPSIAVPFDTADEEAALRPGKILQFSLILIVALVYLASLRQPKPAPPADLQIPDASAVATAAPMPADEARPVGTAGSTTTVKPLAIEIRAVGPCWVDATVDGEHTVARLMNVGDRETVSVRNDLTLRVGDPAAFAFTIDGVEGRSLGSAGHPATVRINRTNYRTLLNQ